MRGGFHWSYGAIAALALVVFGLGVKNYELSQKQTLLMSKLSALETTKPQTFTLQGTDDHKMAVATVILDRSMGRAVVAVQNLPPLPADERYHLWAFTANKQVLCGTFNTRPTGQLVTYIDVEALEYGGAVQFMGVSQESIAAATQPHKTLLVMTSESS